MILEIPIIHFQELFTELRKLSRLLNSDMPKLATTRTFQRKCMEKLGKIGQKLPFFSLKKAFNLAPDHFQNPIFGQIVSLHG